MSRTASAMFAFATRRIARGGLGDVERELLADAADRVGRRVHVERHRAADQLAAQAAEDDVGVRVRRLLPAAR